VKDGALAVRPSAAKKLASMLRPSAIGMKPNAVQIQLRDRRPERHEKSIDESRRCNN